MDQLLRRERLVVASLSHARSGLTKHQSKLQFRKVDLNSIVAEAKMANELVPRLTHQKLIGTKFPGLFVFLLDQSGSMEEDVLPGRTKAEEAAYAINFVIGELLKTNQDGEIIKDRCQLGVIGYGKKVHPLIAGHLPEFNNMILRSDIRDGVEYDVWIEPEHDNGTPMAEALEKALEVAEAWVVDPKNRDNFPPVIINITDGEPNDLDKVTEQAPRSQKFADSLKKLATNDGGLLLFNIHIGQAAASEIVFPTNRKQLPNAEARFLFDISSEIPEALRKNAEPSGLNAEPGSRGMIYNAAPSTLVKLLNFGTQLTQQIDER